jgi:imidazolonepropionase-like amidohydrolase
MGSIKAAVVLIENGKIKEVGSTPRVQTDVPAGTKTTDLGSAILPQAAISYYF